MGRIRVLGTMEAEVNSQMPPSRCRRTCPTCAGCSSLTACESMVEMTLRAGVAAETVPAAEMLTRQQPVRGESWRLLALALLAQRTEVLHMSLGALAAAPSSRPRRVRQRGAPTGRRGHQAG